MSIPVKENIALNIEAAINAITTENGFNQTLTAQRPRRNNWSDVTPEDGRVIIKQADEEIGNQQVQTVTWAQPFILMAIVRDSDDETSTVDSRLNQVESDIKKKLREDPTRGGYAISTDLMPSREFSEGRGFEGISVNIVVNYRTLENDPYTQS